MYLKRIEIFDTRAISHLVVDDLDQRGVVVISGPNETGKTTIADAVKAALTLKASSGAKEVTSLRSRTSGGHPRIILDMRLGDYEFRLDKTFKKGQKSYSIHISEPHRKTLYDAEAHDWLEALIRNEQTKDVWNVFVAEQGKAQQSLALGRFGQLTGALQQATGEAPETEGERNVMQAVAAEYTKYYTDTTGAERKSLTDSTKALERAEVEVRDAREQVRKFEELNKEAELRDHEIAKLKADLPRAKEEVKQRREAVDKLEEFKSAVTKSTATWDQAQRELEYVQQAQKDRIALIDKFNDAQNRLKDLDAAATDAQQRAKEEAQQYDHAHARYQQAGRKLKSTQALVGLYEADLAFYETSQRIEEIEEVLSEVSELNGKLTGFANALSTMKITASDVENLRDATNDYRTKKAVLEAALPKVELSATKSTSISVDGTDLQLEADALPHAVSVTSKTTVTIGDVNVVISPGAQPHDGRQACERAKERVDEILASLQVSSLDEAVQMEQQRRTIADDRDKCRHQLEVKLQGKDYLSLEGELETKRAEHEQHIVDRQSCETKVAQLLQADKHMQADGEISRPDNAAQAKEFLAAAKTSWTEAEEEHQRLGEQLSQLAAKPLSKAAIIAQTKVENQQMLVKSLQQEVRGAREKEADAALFSRVERRTLDVKEAERVRQEAVAKLESQDAAEAEMNLTGALSALENKRAKLDQAEKRRNQIEGELNHFDSAIEKLNEAEERQIRLRRESESLFRRARAAKLLYDTLSEARSRTREAIAEPLLAKMREYGGSLFGRGTEFEMSDDLQIVSRTSDAGTFELAHLSGGAQEQLDILLRLAAAGVMEGDAGAPVIIDDALGYTDEQRLRQMNNAIARAGEQNQVIVLTCDYERFQYVPGATYHSINDLLIS